MKPNAALRVAGGPLGHRVDPVPWLGRFDRRQDQPELAVASLGIGGQPVVAVGQLGEDVVPDDRDRLAQVAGGDALDTAVEISRSGATRSSPTADPPSTPIATAIANMNRSSRSPISGSTAPLAMRSTPKIAERDDRRGQERQRQPRLEREGRVRSGRGSARGDGAHRRAGCPAIGRRRSRRHQPVADAAHRQQVARPVGVDLELLPQAPHGHPDVRRLGLVRLRPATATGASRS